MPEPDKLPLRRALIASANVILPFAIVAALTLFARGWEIERASAEIAELQKSIEARLEGKTVDAVTSELVMALYGEPTPNLRLLEARAEYSELVRALAFRKPDRTKATCDAGRSPFLKFFWALTTPAIMDPDRCQIFDILVVAGFVDRGIQLGILFFFPALFSIFFFHAHGEMNRLGAKLQKKTASLIENIEYRRFEYLLSHGAGAAFSRYGFAAIVGIGMLYVLAPRGIKASILGDFVTLHVTPGAPSYPVWFRSFESAPPHVCGLVGFLLYAMVSCLQRYSMGAITSRLYTALFNRGLVVMLISLVMTSISEGGDKITRALCFMIGMFPQAGLQLASKISQVAADRFSLESSSGFRELNEIDLPKETALREWGITNIHDLAHADLAQLVLDAGIRSSILMEAADKAILIDTFGSERAARLGTLSLFSATDLMRYSWDKSGGRKAEAVSKAAEALQVTDITVQLDNLEQNPNVRFLLHGFVTSEGVSPTTFKV